ncbi:MAG: DUF3592 domain-containing protein [Terracidiphilus sp.]
MLIEIWERLRGYDKWVQVEATIESSNVEETKQTLHGQPAPSTWASRDELVWSDRQGQRRSAEFKIPDDSPLYQLIGGETVTIRYNPAKPEKFYYRELLRTRVHTAIKVIFLGLLFLGALFVRYRYL